MIIFRVRAHFALKNTVIFSGGGSSVGFYGDIRIYDNDFTIFYEPEFISGMQLIRCIYTGV